MIKKISISILAYTLLQSAAHAAPYDGELINNRDSGPSTGTVSSPTEECTDCLENPSLSLDETKWTGTDKSKVSPYVAWKWGVPQGENWSIRYYGNKLLCLNDPMLDRYRKKGMHPTMKELFGPTHIKNCLEKASLEQVNELFCCPEYERRVIAYMDTTPGARKIIHEAIRQRIEEATSEDFKYDGFGRQGRYRQLNQYINSIPELKAQMIQKYLKGLPPISLFICSDNNLKTQMRGDEVLVR